MTQLDQSTITAKIRRIRDNLLVLKKLARMAKSVFTDHPESIAAAERLLQVSIEAMLDIGNHLIGVHGWAAPSEYRDVFIALADHRVLSKRMLPRYLAMVGMRNRLVHVYDDINPATLHQILRDDLADIEKYVVSVLRFVRTRKK